MPIHLRSLFLGSCALLIGCTDPGAQAPDDLASSQAIQPIAAAVKLGAVPLSRDAHGVPNLMRGGASSPKLPAATATESARQHLERLSPAWGLRSAAAMPELEALGEVAFDTGTIVRFRQILDGLPVEPTAGGELHVMVTGDGGLIGVSGKMVSNQVPRASAAAFIDDDAGAIARAVNDKYKTAVASSMFRSARTAADGSRLFAGASPAITVSMSRAHQAWYPAGNALVAVWVVEAYASPSTSADGDAFRTVIASNGKVLARTDLRADAGPSFQYRVFAETTGELHPFDGPIVDSSPNTLPFAPFPSTPPPPAFVTSNLISVVGTNHPTTGTPDPWLAAGATDTLAGNNVHAYTDAHPPDGLTTTGDAATSDFAANVTAPGVFNRTVDLAKDPFDSTDQTKAGITSLFYLLNWMHDFWYDGGFIEAAGNGQDNNYGRGGADHDAMLGEAQDNALDPTSPSRDNANMATPADGLPGKMQVFVWDNVDHRKLTVTGGPPAGFATNTAAFSKPSFNVTGTLILAAGATGTATDGCTALVGAYTGKIVVADRGSCSFQTKAANADAAGAVGMILVNNAPGSAPGLGPDLMAPATTLPTLSVSQADGTAVKAAIGTSATLFRNPDPDLDGTFDVTVVGHEYGHFVHHRLQQCDTQACKAMSEGWADFSALLVSSRQGDDFGAQFPLAIFSTRGISPESQYFGIRRAPYTTNHTVNPLSFRHMAAGEALPPPPFNGGDPANNNEAHNAGEVWASMLWEGYAALQSQPGADFDATRLKMRQYEVAGLMMAPAEATPTETRDAILMAARAKSPDDYSVLAQAYAKRGFGSCAESPDRNSLDLNPIVESAELKGRTDPGELAASGSESCDNDDVLDPGEQFQLVVPIVNGGAAKLTGVTATLDSKLVTFDDPTKATVAVGDLDIGAKASVTFNIKLADGVTLPTESDVKISIASADGCKTVVVPYIARFNADDKPSSSATDTFNAGGLAWTASHAAIVGVPTQTEELWTHQRVDGLHGLVLGAASDAPSDASLTSPDLVAGSAPITMTFDAAWQFEVSPQGPADGGVIEYSTDNGATWNDVTKLDPTVKYNVTLLDADVDNVLHGRKAFGDINPSLTQGLTDSISVNFGTSLANQTFKIRFRIGTDNGTGGQGWLIDNVMFTGITNTPFPTLVADGDHCAPTGATNNHDDGGCCQAGGMTTGNLAAALGVLGLVLRRRRRAAR